MRQWACSLPLNRSPPRACECSYVYLSHISGGLTMAAVGLMIRWDPGLSTVGGMHSALSLRTLVSLVVCEWHESMPAPEGCWEGREGSYCRCEGECSTGAAALSMNRCGPLPDFWSNFWENKQASQQTKTKNQTSKNKNQQASKQTKTKAKQTKYQPFFIKAQGAELSQPHRCVLQKEAIVSPKLCREVEIAVIFSWLLERQHRMYVFVRWCLETTPKFQCLEK